SPAYTPELPVCDPRLCGVHTDEYQRLTGLGWLAAINTERPQVSLRIGATEFIAAVVGALRFAQNRSRGMFDAGEHLVDVIGSHVDRRRARVRVPFLIWLEAAERSAT